MAKLEFCSQSGSYILYFITKCMLIDVAQLHVSSFLDSCTFVLMRRYKHHPLFWVVPGLCSGHLG